MDGWHKLPLELRLEILEFALTPPIELPTPSKINPNDYVSVWFGLQNRKAKNLARDLLLVNRQFHDGVQHIIKCMPEVYHLDVMVVKDYGLWTTWYLPKPPKVANIDEVTVTMRVFGSTDDLQNYCKDPLCYRSKFTHAMRDIHNLFQCLFSLGPGFFSNRNLHNSIIKKMDVNILSATDAVTNTGLWYNEGENPGVLHRRYRPRRSAARRIEEQLEETIMTLFNYISSPTNDLYPLMSRYYNNIGEGILLRINGVESGSLDVDRVMRDRENHGRNAGR